MQKLFTYLTSFVVLLLIQEYILMPLSQSNYFSIYLFFMLLIILDVDIPSWIILIIAAAMGVVCDVMEGGGGLFTAVSVWLGFVRPLIIREILGRDIIFKGGVIIANRVGFKKFFFYSLVMSALWYIPYFLLDNLGNYSYLTWVRVGVSTAITTVIIFVYQLPFNRMTNG
ncbi:MAG: hypothetical protein R3Y19_00085 [Rikenellaceae bacterium]